MSELGRGELAQYVRPRILRGSGTRYLSAIFVGNVGTYGLWNGHQNMRLEVTQPAQRASRKKLVNLFTQNSSAQTENNVGWTSLCLPFYFASSLEKLMCGITIRVVITRFLLYFLSRRRYTIIILFLFKIIAQKLNSGLCRQKKIKIVFLESNIIEKFCYISWQNSQFI